MINQKRRSVLTMTIAVLLVMGICGCEKSEGIVSSEDTLARVTTEVIDMELAHAVKVALVKEEALADAEIVVVASNGEVRLTGIVDNQEQHDRALSAATGVAGVNVVDDKLAVKKQN
jgi:hyperosmotically inducible protein